MTVKLAVVMDPLERVIFKKDSTVAMLFAAQAIGWEIYYIAVDALKLTNSEPLATVQRLKLIDNPLNWYEILNCQEVPLADFTLILMRQDPPFTMEYIYTTYLLDLAEQRGVIVVNKPQSLRDANEKLFTAHFPQCCPPTLVSRNMSELHQFWQQHQQAVFKPLHGMGGNAIFVVGKNDLNINVILETLTHNGKYYIMAQRYIPEIRTMGDKRIILINGKPIAYALARLPSAGDNRGNLAAGGTGQVVPLTERDYWICAQLAPILQQKQLWFVGIDVIGDYLTEINVTSPTCICEISKATGIDIAAQFIEFLQSRIAS